VKYLRTFILLFGFIISFFSTFAQNDVEEKLALQYFQNQEFEKAAEIYLNLYNQNQSQYYYNYYLDCLFELKDFKEAEKFIKNLKKQNNDTRYYIELAYIYQKDGKNRKSIKELDEAFELTDFSKESAVKLANAYHKRGFDDYAVATFEKAKKKSKDLSIHLDFAQLYLEMGKYEKMADEYFDLVQKNDAYISAVQNRFRFILMDAGNEKIQDAIKNTLLQRINEKPNETIFRELLYWFSLQRKEFDIALIQAKSLDKQFKQDGQRVFSMANMMISNKNYELAEDALNHIISLGSKNRFYNSATINILNVKFNKIQTTGIYTDEEINKLVKDYESKLENFGQNSTTIDMMINLSQLYAFYNDDSKKAKDLLNDIQYLPRISKIKKSEAKLLLADIMLYSGEKWSASLLYKQIEKDHKNDLIGSEARFRSAKFFYYVGEMQWAKTQLDVLKAIPEKLIANDALELALLIQENISLDSSYDALSMYAKAEMLIYQNKLDEAFTTIDSLIYLYPNHPINDEAIFLKAKVNFNKGYYSVADSLFEEVISLDPFGLKADNALIHRARIYDQIFIDSVKATELYQKVILDYSGSIYVNEARNRYNNLNKKEASIGS